MVKLLPFHDHIICMLVLPGGIIIFIITTRDLWYACVYASWCLYNCESSGGAAIGFSSEMKSRAPQLFPSRSSLLTIWFNNNHDGNENDEVPFYLVAENLVFNLTTTIMIDVDHQARERPPVPSCHGVLCRAATTGLTTNKQKTNQQPKVPKLNFKNHKKALIKNWW